MQMQMAKMILFNKIVIHDKIVKSDKIARSKLLIGIRWVCMSRRLLRGTGQLASTRMNPVQLQIREVQNLPKQLTL